MKNTPYKKEFNELGELVNPISSYSEDGYINHIPNRRTRRAQTRSVSSRQHNNRSGNRLSVVGSINESGQPVFYKMKTFFQTVNNKLIKHTQVIN